MSGLLDEACDILDDFEKKLTDSVAIGKNPQSSESVKSWHEIFQRMWLHGALGLMNTMN